MLMLTRRAGQSIKIGDDVTVTITDVDGKNVSVGIDAPKHVKVHREEIYERIKNGEPRKVVEVAS